MPRPLIDVAVYQLDPDGLRTGYGEFIQTSPPVLRMANTSASAATLGWSPVAIKFFAEGQSNLLSSSSWSAMTIAPRGPGDDFSVSVPKTNNMQFFRLHQQ